MVISILNDLAERVRENQNNQNSYTDEEGLKRCGICHQRKEACLLVMGEKKILPCKCDCDLDLIQRMRDEERARSFQRYVHELKRDGLGESRYFDWRFDKDNGSNKKMELAEFYVEHWNEMLAKNLGYMIMGPVGTGKSFMAACIANALLEKGIPVKMTKLSTVINDLTNKDADKNSIINQLVSYPLLVIDDFGTERNTEFALEQIYNVIDRRYCSGKPVIMTTNLNVGEFFREDLDENRRRIYSRIKEMCLPVVCDGEDQRNDNRKRKYETLMQMMNMEEMGGKEK